MKHLNVASTEEIVNFDSRPLSIHPTQKLTIRLQLFAYQGTTNHVQDVVERVKRSARCIVKATKGCFVRQNSAAAKSHLSSYCRKSSSRRIIHTKRIMRTEYNKRASCKMIKMCHFGQTTTWTNSPDQHTQSQVHLLEFFIVEINMH